jgi:hypothetical protein
LFENRASNSIRAMANKYTEIVFEVIQEQDGGFVADCLNEDIVTQGDCWDELLRNVREAVSAFFFDSALPERVRLHLVRDEVMTLA